MRNKKIIFLCLFCLFFVSTCSIAFAQETGNLEKSGVTLNEYALLKELAEQTPMTLSEQGFNAEEIAAIQNYHEGYTKHIENLNCLDDETLSKLRYTDEQIQGIRNFEGSEAELMLLSASVNFDSEALSFQYTPGGLTTGRLEYTWSWNGEPYWRLTDMVAVSWNDWDVTNEDSSVTYVRRSNGAFYREDSGVYTNDGNGIAGAAHKYDMMLGDNFFAQEGYGSFDIESDVFAKKNFFYYISYGHSTITGNISFSITPKGASGAVEFDSATTVEAFEEGEYKFPVN